MRALIGCSQSQYSKVENGKLPRPWTWEQYMKPMQYATRDEFRASVLKARRLKALTKRAADEFPLGQHAQGAGEVLALPQTSAPEAGKAVQA